MVLDNKEIASKFTGEFGSITDRFVIKVLSASEAVLSKDPEVVLGGVYVWLVKDRVIKVGRHLENTRKRALEHIRANTGGEMAALEANPDATLILFNLPNPDDLHWAFALEDYFERVLHPKVSSKRRG